MNNRRKTHPKENKTIVFYNNNNINSTRTENYGIIVCDFVISKEYNEVKKQNMLFGNAMLLYLTQSPFYGTWENGKTQEMLNDLEEIYKFMLKQDREKI